MRNEYASIPYLAPVADLLPPAAPAQTGPPGPAGTRRQATGPGTAGCTLVRAAPVAQRIEHLATDDIGGTAPARIAKVNVRVRMSAHGTAGLALLWI
jgi:hypothetical protein